MEDDVVLRQYPRMRSRLRGYPNGPKRGENDGFQAQRLSRRYTVTWKAHVRCMNQRIHEKVKTSSFQEQQAGGYYIRDTATREYLPMTSQSIRTEQVWRI